MTNLNNSHATRAELNAQRRDALKAWDQAVHNYRVRSGSPYTELAMAIAATRAQSALCGLFGGIILSTPQEVGYGL